MAQRRIWTVAVVAFGYAAGGCTPTAKTSTQSSVAGAGGASLPDTVAVSGTVAVDPSGVAAVAKVDPANRKVQLVDTSGAVVAEATTAPTGAFTVALKTTDLSLAAAAAGGTGARLVTLRSLFLAGAAGQESALGLSQQIIVDPAAVVAAAGTSTLDTGVHTARKVGAIVGTIALETGEDATGTDVYVPGTTYIAKTDKGGGFVLGFLPAGSYSIRADRAGYGSVEWTEVTVKRSETTRLPDVVMHIAKGPKVVAFALKDGTAAALVPDVTLRLSLRGATKFRVSQLSDFRDAAYRPVDATKDEMLVDFLLSGADGAKTVYLEVADSDGLTAQASLTVLLDTVAPVVPAYSLQSAGAQPGYTSTARPQLVVPDCGNVTKLALVFAAAPPAAADFALACAAAAAAGGVAVNVPPGDGAKSAYLWAKDGAGRVSAAASASTLTLISAAPVLTVTPPSGPYNDTIQVKAAAGPDVDVYYTTDLSAPTTASPKTAAGLVLLNAATLEFLAVDRAGNQSAVVTRNYTIDRNPPILGSITAQTPGGLSNTPTVTLATSAVGATFMAFAESAAALSAASWTTYATSSLYTLQNVADGPKTVYVKFKDDAGNVIGTNGDLRTSFTLDTQAPAAQLLDLLSPETPSGEFDKLLLWTSSYPEAVTYEVQVYTDAAHPDASVVRPTANGPAMTTSQTSIKVAPVLDPGTYRWRVRARDAAGNPSAWVDSGAAKAFTLSILSNAFQARRTRQGAVAPGGGYYDPCSGGAAAGGAGTDCYYGRDVALLGDWNGNGMTSTRPEIAVSISQTSIPGDAVTPAGVRVGAVRVFDEENNAVLGTVYAESAPLPNTSPDQLASGQRYGQRLLACDLDGDGKDELVVTAPGRPAYDQNAAALYWNQGALYAYAYVNSQVTLVGSFHRAPTDGGLPYGMAGGGAYFGSSFPPWTPLDDAPYLGSGPYLGWSVACERHAGGDRLLVGEPGYGGAAPATGIIGRVVEMALTAGALVPTGLVLPGVEAGAGFGLAVQHLRNFVYPGCNGGLAGQVIVVGAPRHVVGANPAGQVLLYDQSAGSWNTSACAVISAQGSDPANVGFGTTLTDLGAPDFGAGADATTKLAVGAPGLQGFNGGCPPPGGIVRIYGRGAPGALKTIDATGGGAQSAGCTAGPVAGNGDAYGRFGYAVALVGDIDGTGHPEIGISAPSASVNGKLETGAVYVYTWAVLADGDTGSKPTPTRTIIGTPGDHDRFGARLVAVPAAGQTLAVAPDYVLMTRPGFNVPLPQLGPAFGPPAAGPGMAVMNVGSIGEYATVHMKIGTPFRLTGSDTNEGFARSLVGLPDIDGDGIPDLFVGQPSGRCNGVTWGAASLLSGADTKAFKSFCYPLAQSHIGRDATLLPLTQGVLMSATLADGTVQLLALNAGPGMLTSVLGPPLGPPGGVMVSNTMTMVKEANFSFADAVASASDAADVFAYGNYKGGVAEQGQAVLAKVTGGMAPSFAGPGCQVAGAANGDHLGKGVGVVLGPPMAAHAWLLAGAPDAATATPAANGVVYLIDGMGCLLTNGSTIKIKADDAVVKAAAGGAPALAGFGSFVLGLSDLGGNNGYDFVILVANTNVRLEDTSSTPEYFVFGVTLGGVVTVLRHEVGPAGSMLGGYAKVIGDLDGNGKADLALSAPEGVGRYGNTGQVEILSGELLLAQAPNAVIQVIQNPEQSVSHFGISLAFADFTGDGIKDLLIGADKLPVGGAPGVGGLYVFPLQPVQQ